jgi:hypothetical protein
MGLIWVMGFYHPTCYRSSSCPRRPLAGFVSWSVLVAFWAPHFAISFLVHFFSVPLFMLGVVGRRGTHGELPRISFQLPLCHSILFSVFGVMSGGADVGKVLKSSARHHAACGALWWR